MAKNLCYQMTSSIENALALGADKHSLKKQEINSYKIYSYASRKEMIDFSHDFSSYIKMEYPTIKYVKEITTAEINNYLSSKKSLTQASVEQYIARINKLELCCKKKFGIELDWRTGRIVPKQNRERIRTVVFTDKQIKGLENYFETKRDCYSKSAFYLGKTFALRAASICKIQVRDVDLDKMVLHIHEDKGKRSRDIKIMTKDKEFLSKLIDGKKNTDRIIPLRADSICAYLNRACKTLGYTNIVNAKSSYHCLRKYSITKYYMELLPICGKQKAEEICSLRLGHGANRRDIIDKYIFK